MGQVGDNLEKKYKEVLASRELIDDALDLDKRLEKLSTSLKAFEKEMHPK